MDELSSPVLTAAGGARAAEGGLLSTRRGAVIFSAAVPAAALLLKLITPLVIWLMTHSIPRCLMDYFGLRCPLCGGTHCAAALARFDIAGAVYYNPLVVAAIVYLLIWYVRVIVSCFCLNGEYRRARLYRDPVRFAWITLTVTVLFEIVRNLPFYRAVLY